MRLDFSKLAMVLAAVSALAFALVLVPGCNLESSDPPTESSDPLASHPHALIEIPVASQDDIGIESIFLTSDDRVYITFPDGVDPPTSVSYVVQITEQEGSSRYLRMNDIDAGSPDDCYKLCLFAIILTDSEDAPGLLWVAVAFAMEGCNEFAEFSDWGASAHASSTSGTSGTDAEVALSPHTQPAAPPSGASEVEEGPDVSACYDSQYDGGDSATAYCQCLQTHGVQFQEGGLEACIAGREASEEWLSNVVGGSDTPDPDPSCALTFPITCTCDVFPIDENYYLFETCPSRFVTEAPELWDGDNLPCNLSTRESFCWAMGNYAASDYVYQGDDEGICQSTGSPELCCFVRDQDDETFQTPCVFDAEYTFADLIDNHEPCCLSE